MSGINITNFTIELKYTCPKTRKKAIVIIDKNNFYFYDIESHGELSIYVDCYKCGKNHEIILTSW